jgi:hypothetical protein
MSEEASDPNAQTQQVPEAPTPPAPPVGKDGGFPSQEELVKYQKTLYTYYSKYYMQYYIPYLHDYHNKVLPGQPLPMYMTNPTPLQQPDSNTNTTQESTNKDQDPTPEDKNDTPLKPEVLEYYETLHNQINQIVQQSYTVWYQQQITMIQYLVQLNPQKPAQQQNAPPDYPTNQPTIPETIEHSAYESYPAAGAEDYTAKGFFNKRTNRFQPVANHWESKGLPTDREGRQLAAFFDVDSYQQLQAQSAISKKSKQPKQSAKYWKKVKEEKKKKKYAKAYADDT